MENYREVPVLRDLLADLKKDPCCKSYVTSMALALLNYYFPVQRGYGLIHKPKHGIINPDFVLLHSSSSSYHALVEVKCADYNLSPRWRQTRDVPRLAAALDQGLWRNPHNGKTFAIKFDGLYITFYEHSMGQSSAPAIYLLGPGRGKAIDPSCLPDAAGYHIEHDFKTIDSLFRKMASVMVGSLIARKV